MVFTRGKKQRSLKLGATTMDGFNDPSSRGAAHGLSPLGRFQKLCKVPVATTRGNDGLLFQVTTHPLKSLFEDLRTGGKKGWLVKGGYNVSWYGRTTRWMSRIWQWPFSDELVRAFS
ncbi:hypothetical protein HAX54_021801 [Datura stramonium]|uniref:Uncharacterized protein n=1 Tax=Datura stramonium TaxID=4076 RepID=A0ABS8UVC5_DATST|nr:hypothetical protein [Datura stramonium]